MEINPGENAYLDTMESRTPGLVAQSTGKLTSRHIKGANVFVDESSDYTHVHHVEDQTLESIMRSKADYERLALTFGNTIKGCHSDNGRFGDEGWTEDCIQKSLRFKHCGVGQHAQNSIAERRIRDLSENARACLLHATQRWP